MKFLVLLFVLLFASQASALSINPMLQNNMVLQKSDGNTTSYINGTAATGSTITIQWPCPNPTAGTACTAPYAFGPRTLESSDQGKWFYNLDTGDYTDLSTITTYQSGGRMRIAVLGDTTNCATPSAYLVNGALVPKSGPDAPGSIVSGNTLCTAASTPYACCTGAGAGACGNACVIDLTGVLVGENWICSGQSALVPQYTGHTCVASGTPPQMCDKWPAIRSSSETTYQWHDDIAAPCFWLAIELQNKLKHPIGIIERAVEATGIKRWSGDSVCAEPEMFGVIDNEWNGSCSNRCSGGSNDGNVCLTDSNNASCTAVGLPWDCCTGSGTGTCVDDCPGGTCLYDINTSDTPHQTPSFGLAWGDLYADHVYPMWPFGARGVFWFQGQADAGNDAIYRHALPSLARSWRRDRSAVANQIGGLPTDELTFIWIQNTPKGAGANRCTSCSPDTNTSAPERSLANAEPTGWADLQDDEFDDPMHAAYFTGYFGQTSGGCRKLNPTPGAASACPANAVAQQDGKGVTPCRNCYMMGSNDFEAGLHPKNSMPYARLVSNTALTQIYGYEALTPGFSNAWSGPNLVGMRVGTPAGGKLQVSLCFAPGTANQLFGMQIPEQIIGGVKLGGGGPNDYPYVLNGFACYDKDDTPSWKGAPALINGEQIIVECPYTGDGPELIRYDKSRFEGPRTLYGNVFNGDTMGLPSFIADVADQNTAACTLVDAPTPIPTPTGATLTPTLTHTAGPTFTPTPTVAMSACMTELVGLTGAVAGYHLDETTGSVAYDSVGLYDGSYTESVTLGQSSLLPGDSNGAVLFGANAAMQVPANDPDFFPTEESLLGFFQTTNPSAQLIDHQDSAGLTTRLSVTMDSGLVTLTAGVGSTCDPISISSVATYNDGQPHRFVGVFNSSQQLELYVDNAAVVQSSTSLGALCPLLLAGVVSVGSNANLSLFSDATIDEPRIYGRAITSGEVASITTACAPLPTPTISSTVTRTRTPTRTPTPTPTVTATPGGEYISTGCYVGDDYSLTDTGTTRQMNFGLNPLYFLVIKPTTLVRDPITNLTAPQPAYMYIAGVPEAGLSMWKTIPEIEDYRFSRLSYSAGNYYVGWEINRGGVEYCWWGMIEGRDMKVGNYVGDGSENRVIGNPLMTAPIERPVGLAFIRGYTGSNYAIEGSMFYDAKRYLINPTPTPLSGDEINTGANPVCCGDLNNDFYVTVDEMIYCQSSTYNVSQCDCDNNGIIDGSDLAIIHSAGCSNQSYSKASTLVGGNFVPNAIKEVGLNDDQIILGPSTAVNKYGITYAYAGFSRYGNRIITGQYRGQTTSDVNTTVYYNNARTIHPGFAGNVILAYVSVEDGLGGRWRAISDNKTHYFGQRASENSGILYLGDNILCQSRNVGDCIHSFTVDSSLNNPNYQYRYMVILDTESLYNPAPTVSSTPTPSGTITRTPTPVNTPTRTRTPTGGTKTPTATPGQNDCCQNGNTGGSQRVRCELPVDGTCPSGYILYRDSSCVTQGFASLCVRHTYTPTPSPTRTPTPTITRTPTITPTKTNTPGPEVIKIKWLGMYCPDIKFSELSPFDLFQGP